MLSAVAGIDIRKLEQSIGTPLANVIDKEKWVEENEEIRDEEKTTIQTLVELPKIGTPTQTLQKPSTDMLALQVQTLGSSSTKVARTLHYEIIELDEDIKIPYCESSTLIEEEINEI